ncbi:sugar phosphate nucleotidyltransferase [Marinibaculum pumilum]|uniref:Sugar phosphate nucleotidyltransferase n=1 Tax=Marinibaculum pumilum TaxID=1766165 RepID=A0ABV7L397_9PROT
MSPPVPDIVVLAGGLGTRLRDVVEPGLPKLLVPIHGRPFLDYLLSWLRRQGATRVTFALGYGADRIIPALQQRTGCLPFAIDWTVETAPRGTAGAIALALHDRPSGPGLVINGDTLVDIHLPDFCAAFPHQAELGLVAVKVPDAARFGLLSLDAQNRVARFLEKPHARPAGGGWINGGIYLLSEPVMARLRGMAEGSFERDVMMRLPPGTIWAWPQRCRFLDIGTASSLSEAFEVLAPLAEGFRDGALWRGSATVTPAP